MFLKEFSHVATPGREPPGYQFPMLSQNCILRFAVGARLSCMLLKDFNHVATPGCDPPGYQFPMLTQNCILNFRSSSDVAVIGQRLLRHAAATPVALAARHSVEILGGSFVGGSFVVFVDFTHGAGSVGKWDPSQSEFKFL